MLQQMGFRRQLLCVRSTVWKLRKFTLNLRFSQNFREINALDSKISNLKSCLLISRNFLVRVNFSFFHTVRPSNNTSFYMNLIIFKRGPIVSSLVEYSQANKLMPLRLDLIFLFFIEISDIFCFQVTKKNLFFVIFFFDHLYAIVPRSIFISRKMIKCVRSFNHTSKSQFYFFSQT